MSELQLSEYKQLVGEIETGSGFVREWQRIVELY